MRNGLLYSILAMTVIFVTAVQAQAGAAERDPFFPSAGRPGAPVPPPPSREDAWGRDPFNNPLARRAPAQTGAPSAGTIHKLTGIIYSTDVRLAIIGNETYPEGSTVGDRILTEIRMRSVVFKSAAGDQEEVFLENFTMSK